MLNSAICMRLCTSLHLRYARRKMNPDTRLPYTFLTSPAGSRFIHGLGLMMYVYASVYPYLQGRASFTSIYPSIHHINADHDLHGVQSQQSDLSAVGIMQGDPRTQTDSYLFFSSIFRKKEKRDPCHIQCSMKFELRDHCSLFFPRFLS